MTYSHFSLNGQLLPIEQAAVPLASVEYSYGFGVYETIRLSAGTLFFPDEHCHRLMESAKVIGLEHDFSADAVQTNINQLVRRNDAATCNIKVLLIGGKTSGQANLYILCLNPFFPDRKLYKTGALCTTYIYERDFPAAKTLNMLPSYIAYRQAAAAGAYDALLIDADGHITEGTRTNFFTIKDRTIFTPPEAKILPGVTRNHVLHVAQQNGFEVTQQDISSADLGKYDGAFLTSTSSKIMPIKTVDDYSFGGVPQSLTELMLAYEQYLETFKQ